MNRKGRYPAIPEYMYIYNYANLMVLILGRYNDVMYRMTWFRLPLLHFKAAFLF